MLVILTATFDILKSLSVSQYRRSCKWCASLSWFCQENTQIWPVKKVTAEHSLYSQILLPKSSFLLISASKSFSDQLACSRLSDATAHNRTNLCFYMTDIALVGWKSNQHECSYSPSLRSIGFYLVLSGTSLSKVCCHVVCWFVWVKESITDTTESLH